MLVDQTLLYGYVDRMFYHSWNTAFWFGLLYLFWRLFCYKYIIGLKLKKLLNLVLFIACISVLSLALSKVVKMAMYSYYTSTDDLEIEKPILDKNAEDSSRDSYLMLWNSTFIIKDSFSPDTIDSIIGACLNRLDDVSFNTCYLNFVGDVKEQIAFGRLDPDHVQCMITLAPIIPNTIKCSRSDNR
ncbi:MAG: hypothetical protein HRU19_27640 [Pseudobacteriovorax sp.]|nr:hypothetical protein [Pseudobacteriovorax sp.]